MGAPLSSSAANLVAESLSRSQPQKPAKQPGFSLAALLAKSACHPLCGRDGANTCVLNLQCWRAWLQPWLIGQAIRLPSPTGIGGCHVGVEVAPVTIASCARCGDAKFEVVVCARPFACAADRAMFPLSEPSCLVLLPLFPSTFIYIV